MASIVDEQSGLRFGYPQGDDNWGPGFNENFARLAYIGPNRAIESITSTPPAAPNPSDRYIVGASPTGDWSGFAENDIVVWGYSAPGYSTLGWVNFTPTAGWRVFNEDNGQSLVFNGTAWTQLTGAGTATITTDDTLTENPLSVVRPIPAGGTAGQVLKRTATGYEWGAASGTGLTAGEVQGVVTAQLGTRVAALIECYLQQNTERRQFAYTPYSFTNNNSSLLAGGDGFNRGGCSVLLIQGYDPIPIQDDDMLALTVGTRGSPLTDAQSLVYDLSRNGAPTGNMIRVGREVEGNSLAEGLIAKSADSSNFNISALLATITGMDDISQIKRIIESAVGNKRIDQQALQGVLHTELFSGTAPDAATYATAKGGSVLLRASDGKMFYKGASASSSVTNRDQVQFTTGGDNKYLIGSSGIDTRSYNHLFGGFHREAVTATTFRYVLLLREDELPTGFSQLMMQFAFEAGSSLVTGTYETYSRAQTRDQVIAGHKYLAYQTTTATVATRAALDSSQLYTGHFRSAGAGNPPINVWPATAVLPGVWGEVPVGSMARPVVAQTIAIRNQQTTYRSYGLLTNVLSLLHSNVTPSAEQQALVATGNYRLRHYIRITLNKTSAGSGTVRVHLTPVTAGVEIFESDDIFLQQATPVTRTFWIDTVNATVPYRVMLIAPTAGFTVQAQFDSICIVAVSYTHLTLPTILLV